jgi:cellulose synthase/poly-beta-1,6-N-acetylglucosamine synthase-like glycosyltransferase
MFGLAGLLYYFSWWFEDGRLHSPVYFLWFAAALVFSLFQVLYIWTIDLAAFLRPQRSRTSAANLTVDVFVAACGEPYQLVERSLKAACGMRGDHHTWLLDDERDPALKALASKLGAGYLTRQNRQDAKAGNINAALARTDGEIVVIFDIDHVPDPHFLERSLPLFNDPGIGFVQVMLTFDNEQDSRIAHAAAQTTLEFYNPVSVGADHLGSATLIGSNDLIRRDALASIGRYQPGLAEDLATSLALHTSGWRSAYVHEPMAPGMAPPDLAAWFTQQLKWSRGVFELLLTAYPRLFRRLTPGQHIAYGARMTYYWIGLATALHILLAVIVLWGDNLLSAQTFTGYLQHFVPLAAMIIVTSQLALLRWRHTSIPLKECLFRLRAYTLVISTWPAYTLTWLLTIFRIPLTFRPTPKTKGDGLHPIWLVPNLAAALLIGLGLARFIVTVGDPRPYWLLLIYLSFVSGTQLFLPIWWLIELAGNKRAVRPSTAVSLTDS